MKYNKMFISNIIVSMESVDTLQICTCLLELVTPKNLQLNWKLTPGTLGYNTAWQRLKREYGETKHVRKSHISQIIYLPMTKGTSYPGRAF